MQEDIEMGEIIPDKQFEYGKGEKAVELLLLKNQVGLGLIGMISSKRFIQNVALVVNEDNPVGKDFGPAYHGSLSDGTGHRIGMDADLIEGLRTESDEALMILFHELGHMVNHDIIPTGESEKLYNQNRIDMVRSGKVSDMELRADDFASEYLGEQVVINGLMAHVEREKRTYSPEEYAQEDIDALINELQYRISYQANKGLHKSQGSF